MKETFSKFEEQRKQVESEIIPTLKEIVTNLTQLTTTGKIESFSFLQNDDYLANEKPVYISINGKTFDDLRLGMFDNVADILKIKKMTMNKETLKTLNDMNGTLYFLNENFCKVMPIVERTYYSNNAVNQEEGFKENPVKNLLPSFMFENEKTNKPKF